MDGWMDGRESRVKDCLQQSTKKAWLLNRWVDGWMGGLKLNYNGGPFSKMVRFLKIKFLIIIKISLVTERMGEWMDGGLKIKL